LIPLYDTIKSRRFPMINWLLIASNTAIFVYVYFLGVRGAENVIVRYGLVPTRLLSHMDLYNLETAYTSMFLHGGWLHLIGNMLALFIFGDNVEDRIGHLGYLLFYLICGTAAAAVQVIVSPSLNGPVIGASGAISGVLAAYMILYPRARVVTLFLLFFLPWFIEVPAVIYIGFWFMMQLFSEVASVAGGVQAAGGIAFGAHIGGFLTGLLLVWLFRPGSYKRVEF
jgi:membrane associated rhomboid family serine protease